jgi:hypothetical protein
VSPFVLRLRCHLLLLAGLCLGSLALAHEGHFNISDLQVIEEEGERFLGMRVTYGKHDTPLSFSAALIDGEAATLEVRRGSSYRAAERLVVDPGVHVFDATSPLRVRLPDGLALPRGRQAHTATLLFEPGFLITQQVPVGGTGVTGGLTWRIGLVLSSLVVLGAGTWFVVRRRVTLRPLP